MKKDVISQLLQRRREVLEQTRQQMATRIVHVQTVTQAITQEPVQRCLPAGVRLGYFTGQDIPAVAPFTGQPPYLFQYTDGTTQQNTLLLLQQVVVDIEEATDREEVKVMVLDPSRNSFPFLNKLSMPFVELLTDERKAQNRLEMVNAEVSRIHADCVTAGHSDILQYNAAAEYPEPFHLLVIANFEAIQDSSLLSLIHNLSSRQEAGFYLLAACPTISDQTGLSFTQAHQKRQAMAKMWTVLQVEGQEIKGTIPRLADWVDFGVHLSVDHGDLAQRVNLLKKMQEKNSQQANFLRVPIGRIGARPFFFELGEGVSAYHVLVGGQTGSGKSNLLNNIIVQLGELYSSDEIRLQLMDYKGGVEFACYKDHPSVEVLLTDNEDIENGLRVLELLQQQIEERSRLFLKVGAKNIEGYRKKSDDLLHRIILIIDEFQVLFSGRNRDRANRLLKDVARRGRSFGLHLILSSQSLKDYALDTDLKNQLGARIVLPIEANECGNFLHVDNDAPSSLPKYHAVINTMGGKTAFNQIVKLNFLSDEDLALRLQELQTEIIGAPFEQRLFAAETNVTIPDAPPQVEPLNDPVGFAAFDDLLDSMGMKPEKKEDKKTGDSAFDDLLDSFNL